MTAKSFNMTDAAEYLTNRVKHVAAQTSPANWTKTDMNAVLTMLGFTSEPAAPVAVAESTGTRQRAMTLPHPQDPEEVAKREAAAKKQPKSRPLSIGGDREPVNPAAKTSKTRSTKTAQPKSKTQQAASKKR